jgi:hypothetical protein
MRIPEQARKKLMDLSYESPAEAARPEMQMLAKSVPLLIIQPRIS